MEAKKKIFEFTTYYFLGSWSVLGVILLILLLWVVFQSKFFRSEKTLNDVKNGSLGIKYINFKTGYTQDTYKNKFMIRFKG